MFYLSLIEHTLRLPPSLLSLPLQDAIKQELENTFLDKVIANLGLCISVYDIRKLEGGFIFPGDGASTYVVEFRMVVFRPFVGEIIAAKLKESNKDGLRSHRLPNPSIYERDPGNRYQVVWSWEYDSEDNNKFIIDGLDEIKFRVENVEYPPVPIEQPEKPFAPMVITGTLDDDGLGPVSWW
ncbi:DNA-directed RNA polymerase III subunit RPC8 isoform X4 [Manihot esculenta]|uniref:DNA-directed RNA polymerase III subunit RPC8 isoform X4 n=1 Tax=Manihot esculenta TaxID=3983 RepID=UPI000B5D2EC0|nr:DNA-directed RNA polymerase III subunit RPC8 isoform X4 [Manihot esculenta]